MAGLHAQVLADPSVAAGEVQSRPAEDAADPAVNAAVAADQAAIPAPGTPADPPARVARLAVLNGAVSATTAGSSRFASAELNEVLTSGDRVYTDAAAATAELQAGQLALRLGAGADLTVTALTDAVAQFGLAAGSVHLRSLAVDAGTVLELDSPEAAVTVLRPGDVRVDVDAVAHTTTVDLIAGQVQVDTPTSSQLLAPGGRVRIHGEDASAGVLAYAEPLAPQPGDSLDGFSGARDSMEASGADAGAAYINPDTVGAADLASNGTWDATDMGDIGPIWYPAVSVGWRPYCFGHWRYVRPWGWTWVGAEPWAFAPFHYGRWTQIDGRWGWIPGSRVVRPVYAPALVAFAGGAQFAESAGFPAGFGITAWFPLGPHEPYVPPYASTTRYLNRVNASNLYNPDASEARALSNQRAANAYPVQPAAERSFANRGLGTVVVPQTSFIGGRSVSSNLLQLPETTLATAPVLSRPLASPVPGSPELGALINPHLPVPRPAMLARPVMAGRGEVLERQGLDGSPAGVVFFHRSKPPAGPGRLDLLNRPLLPSGAGRSPNSPPPPARSAAVGAPARAAPAAAGNAPHR